MREFKPLVPRVHDRPEVNDLYEWLDRNRPEIETKMAILGCTSAESVVIMLLNRIASETIDMNEPIPDDWGPGADPTNQED